MSRAGLGAARTAEARVMLTRSLEKVCMVLCSEMGIMSGKCEVGSGLMVRT